MAEEEKIVLSVVLSLPSEEDEEKETIQLLIETDCTNDQWISDSDLRASTIQDIITDILKITVHPSKGEMH